MTHSRRDFIKGALLGGAALGLAPVAVTTRAKSGVVEATTPRIVSTWQHGLAANDAAWPILGGSGYALDAVEAGARVTEADPDISTVGLGGLPDRDGRVTLDACVMNEHGDAGSVACLQDVVHASSVARLVMEQTPHVMLAGEGARRFALDNGFEAEELMTPEAEAAWRAWLREEKYEPEINVENHDTISLLALDDAGRLGGCCTTSGLAYKMHGRVGDSPIIGASLFVDGAVGAACATGLGEAVMKTLGSFLVVELMRGGRGPQAACAEAVRRIVATNPRHRDLQVGYLAMSRDGRHGAYSIHPGFNYALRDEAGGRLVDAPSFYR